MKNNKVRIGDAIRHLGARNTVVALMCILAALIMIAGVFYSLYNSVKETIWMRGELNSMQSAKDFDVYLMTGTDAVKMAAYTVNEMMQENRSREMILQFLEEETVNIQNTIDRKFTGLYGWIEGEFMDGSGWVPDPDYVPTERPWYVESMEQGDVITYVTPYLDLDTGTVMMTITSRLDDGESILALDIALNRLQEITKEIASTTEGSIGMVLDSKGGVVAHSEPAELGRQYLEEKDTLGSLIAQKLIVENQPQFEIRYGDTSYMVNSQRIQGGWYSVSAINADISFRRSRMILILAIIIMLLATGIIGSVFIRISSRELMTQNLAMELKTIADIYESVYDIDLERDTFREISSRSDIAKTVGEHNSQAQNTLYSAMEQLTDDVSKHVIHEFVDLSSLEERLDGQISITEEFLDLRKNWCRGRFIAAERDSSGKLVRVLWLVESIDAEKRRSEELLHLSETDRMTGLYNRVSGENQIEGMLSAESGGMFLMVDADKFKKINDTFGHSVGDEVLIAIANGMKSAFRNGDVIMRLGGDEFGAFAPGVETAEVGEKIVRRLFDALDNTHVEALNAQKISVSVGVAFCEKNDGLSFQQLYERADGCVYESKGNGGHCATFYG